MSSDQRGTTSGRTDLEKFEKNRYFYGKLMTARDMQTEQDYHTDKLNTLARLVAGEGIICGLEVSEVVQADENQDTIEVTVEPGVALDCTGRLLVVESRTTQDIEILPGVDEVFLYLSYRETSKDPVPMLGAETARDVDCTPNRLVEEFEVFSPKTSTEDGPRRTRKPVPTVETPARDELDSGDDASALARVARSYYEGNLSSCQACETPWVFLGSFTKGGSDGVWKEGPETANRPLVYTNDMLYAAIVRHITDFDNPHEVSAEMSDELIEELQNRVNAYVNESTAEFGDRLDSLEKQVDSFSTRQDSLEQYAMSKTLKYKIRSFNRLDSEFRSGTAGEIVETTRKAIDDKVFIDRDEYLDFIEGLLDWESGLERELQGEATDDSLERYSEALDELKGVVEEARDGGSESILPLVLAQDRLCDAADWMQK